jgi:hypothetical protein
LSKIIFFLSTAERKKNVFLDKIRDLKKIIILILKGFSGKDKILLGVGIVVDTI